MSKVIPFLERLGAEPALTAARFQALLAQAGLEPAERAAFERRDAHALNGLLCGRNQILFALLPVDPDQKGDEEPLDRPEPTEPPAQPESR